MSPDARRDHHTSRRGLLRVAAVTGAVGSGLLLPGAAHADLTLVQVQRAAGVTADGLYGDATRSAVLAYQRRHGLPADGRAGATTRRHMGVTRIGENPGSGTPSPILVDAWDRPISRAKAVARAKYWLTAHNGGPVPYSMEKYFRGPHAHGGQKVARGVAPAPMSSTSPTGAALVRGLANTAGPQPAMTQLAHGIDTGTEETPGRPDVVRVVIGDPVGHPTGSPRDGIHDTPASAVPIEVKRTTWICTCGRGWPMVSWATAQCTSGSRGSCWSTAGLL
ncbi:DUF111 family protein [Brachybacterium sp. EF45031]|uniref:peptidoglycan-binding domain-containing protein n=1 Tax=Brachybacterium sillae TaxID=2810536 RepID=UPI00217D8F8A|nr:nickel insertion protein [Brachybacterium sillae]MCS6711890.1 DUF111 family protein [Brachybacterium sillae]